MYVIFSGTRGIAYFLHIYAVLLLSYTYIASERLDETE